MPAVLLPTPAIAKKERATNMKGKLGQFAWAAAMLVPVLAAIAASRRENPAPKNGSAIPSNAHPVQGNGSRLEVPTAIDRASRVAPQQRPRESEPPPSTPAANPLIGPHFGDDFSRAAAARWQHEKRDPGVSSLFEAGVRDLFEHANASRVLDEVECRETLCKLSLNAYARSHDENGEKLLAGRLGNTVVVLESDDGGMTVLVQRDEIVL